MPRMNLIKINLGIIPKLVQTKKNLKGEKRSEGKEGRIFRNRTWDFQLKIFKTFTNSSFVFRLFFFMEKSISLFLSRCCYLFQF